MATISERLRKDGSKSFQVRWSFEGERDSCTFPRMEAAERCKELLEDHGHDWRAVAVILEAEQVAREAAG